MTAIHDMQAKFPNADVVPPAWPQPLAIDGLSTRNALNLAKDYINTIQDHLNSLNIEDAEHGVPSEVILPFLKSTVELFSVIYEQPSTTPNLREDIDNFGMIMQALADYMRSPAVVSDSDVIGSRTLAIRSRDMDQNKATDTVGAIDSPGSSDTASSVMNDRPQKNRRRESKAERKIRKVRIAICDQEFAKSELVGIERDQLKFRLVQDLRDQGVSIPIISCKTSRACRYASLLTSSMENAAILRDATIWKPRIFGEGAYVVVPRRKDAAGVTTAPPFMDQVKLHRAEQYAERNTRIVKVTIPDREYAKAKLIDMESGQLRSRIELDLQTQDIEVTLDRCKKSGVCNHIRVWTVSTQEANILLSQWKPVLFGKGACVGLYYE
ncbi:MAG: hypothetical protein Q9166_006278 [cf. Caloplaca sp. 2 TL-2023]